LSLSPPARRQIQPATEIASRAGIDKFPPRPGVSRRPVAAECLCRQGAISPVNRCAALEDVLHSPTRQEILERPRTTTGSCCSSRAEPQRNAAARELSRRLSLT
jgi:hypothetical protein